VFHAGNEAATAESQQAQEAAPRAQPTATRNQWNILNHRISEVDRKVDEYHTISQASIGSLRSHINQQFSTFSKEIHSLRIQPQRQMWHAMYRRQQQQGRQGLNQQQQQPQQQEQENPLGDVGAPTITGVGLPRLLQPRPPRLALEGNRVPLLRAELGNPRTLHDLWTEWTHGIGGLKPAKDFTREERGRDRTKCKYCRRKVFWMMVQKHVLAGISANMAIQRIYQCYGESNSVTTILRAMIKDKPDGHPSLRV